MPDVVTQTTSDSNTQNPVPPANATAPVNSEPQKTPTPIVDVPTSVETATESKEEKLRKAKIAMEGLDRTVRREADEKEEEASEEKQQLNRLLVSINHEKELLELTWVSLDNKRTSLKKVLDPILSQEDQIQSEENQVESKEDVTVTPKEKHEIEGQRWEVQQKRKKVEEEKWVVEEKITKLEEQIDDTKKKYQTLLDQEEEIRTKVQAIDEQILLQQEVLKQQRELEEEKKRQAALKQVEEEKQRSEAEKRRVEEIRKAELDRKQAEELKAQELQKQQAASASSAAKKIEDLRRAEEEKQKQETTRQQSEAARAEELRKKLAEMMDHSTQKNAGQTLPPIVSPAQPKAPTEEKQDATNRSLELERIHQENEEVDIARRQKISEQKQKIIKNTQGEEGGIKPLRTLQGDVAEAMKNQQISPEDIKKSSKKAFPWF